MKTRKFTIPVPYNKSKAITFILWEDLSLAKVNNMYVLIGYEVAKNQRISAMERVDTHLVTVGPVGIIYSKGYLREE